MTQRQPTQEREHALSVLREGRRFLLAGHVRPDGDCVGSQAALARALQALGKQVRIVNPDRPGVGFERLLRTGPFSTYEGGALPEHDVIVLLDINQLSRCGAMEPHLAASPARKVVIDHHPSHEAPWWDAAYVDVAASATGLLVWRIARELGVEPDPVLAEGVFTALVADTGWFRYSNTDAETLEVAARLVALGVDPAATFARLNQRNAPEEPLSLARVLGRLEYLAGGRLAVVDEPLGARPLADADAVLDILRSVEDVEVVLYLKELEGGACKLSARSKTSYDVNALARKLGGGGHVRAAGATIPGPLADVRGRVVRAALEDF